MPRRTLAILIALLVTLASAGAWWIAGRESLPNSASTPELSTADETTVESRSTIPTREIARSTPERELQDAWWIEGRVIVPPGTPADEHVEVNAIGRKFASRPHHRVPIGPDGSFRVAFAPGTGLGSLILDAKYLFLPTEVTLSPSSQKTGTELHPVIGGCVRGRVVVPPQAEDLKQLLVGFQIDVGAHREFDTPLGWASSRRGAGIDANLVFEARGVPAGERTIDLRIPGAVQRAPTKVQVEPGRTSDVIVELVRSANVAGIVVDPAGIPIGTDLFAETNRQGRFDFTALPHGIYRLQATDGKFRRAAVPFDGSIRAGIVMAEGGSIDDIELHLPGFGRVTGRVTGPDGKGVGGALALAHGRDWSLGDDFRGVPRTDADGRFAIDGLPLGEVSITAVKQSYVASAEAHAIVRAGETAEVEIALVPGTRLRFTAGTSPEVRKPFEFVARDERGREWTLYPGWFESPESSSDREFDDPSYGPLPRGRYEIVATTWNGENWSGSADLRGEDEVTVSMKLDP